MSIPAHIATLAGGGPWDRDTQRLVARMSASPPTRARVQAIDALVKALKTSGAWDQLDLLYLLAAHSTTAALLNWRAPGVATLLPVNSPTFTIDRGYAGNGLNAALSASTAWVPANDARRKYKLDTATLGCYVQSASSTANGVDVYTTNGYLRLVSGAYVGRINDGTNLSSGGAPAVGHWCVRRTAAGARAIWKNGAQVASDATASTTFTGAVFAALGTGSGAQPSNARLSAAYAGAALTDAQMVALDTALTAYLTAVGVLP